MHTPSFQRNLTIAGSWFAVISCFSISVLGTAATTITTTATILLWFLSLQYKNYLTIIKSHPFTIIAAFLFIYLGISLIWSEHLSEGLSLWKKYREFILLPIFLTFFRQNKYRQYGSIALYAGMFCTLLISYLVYFDFFPFSPRLHRIGNHIFLGILLSFFAYWSLLLAIEHKRYRLLFIIFFITSFFCIFIVREGRTGYILFITLSVLFIVQTWKWKGALSITLLITSFFCFILLSSISLPTIDLTPYTSFNLDNFTKADIRIEFYINTLRIILDNFWFGVGIGDYSSSYITILSTRQNFWGPTTNAHNEFLMITAQTGIIGLLLFLTFIIYLLKASLKLTPARSKLAIACTITIGISCLFNSSFLDNNDGTLFMLFIALFYSFPKSSTSPS